MAAEATSKKRKWGIGPIDDFIARHRLRDKFEALGPEKVANVVYRGQELKFYIPDAMTDKMQLPALMGHLHEGALLDEFSAVVKPGGVVLDLGANHGSHMIYFAVVMKSKLVHAFEPQPRMAEILRETVRLNKLTNVVVHEAAAGAKSGFVRVSSTDAENTGMASFRPDANSSGIVMQAIDDVINDAPVTGVKIDVEGMQMPALRGMVRTIRRDRPVLWLELRPAKGEVEEPTNWLLRHGYEAKQVSFRDFFFLPKTI